MENSLKGGDRLRDHVITEVFIIVMIKFGIHRDQTKLVQTQPLPRKPFAESTRPTIL